MIPMATDALRDSQNQNWTKLGAGLANPTGRNQWSSRLASNRRLDLAVADRIEEKPQCAQAYADKVIAALADPLSEKVITDIAIGEFAHSFERKLKEAGIETQRLLSLVRSAVTESCGTMRRGVGKNTNLELLRFALGPGLIESILGKDAAPADPPALEAGPDPWEALAGAPSAEALTGEQALIEVKAGEAGAD